MGGSEARRIVPRTVAVGASAVGLAAGSYGVASAASGLGSPTTMGSAAPWRGAHGNGGPPGGGSRGGGPWGSPRSDEKPLTGDALAKVTAVAKANVPGGKVVRVETDADGNAAYEAHMTNASGAPVTVYVDTSFDLVKVETR